MNCRKSSGEEYDGTIYQLIRKEEKKKCKYQKNSHKNGITITYMISSYFQNVMDVS